MERKRQSIPPVVKEEPEKIVPVTDGKIWFQKKGGGSLRIFGRIIKPNEKFKARPQDIPESFKDIIVPLEKYDVAEEVSVKQPAKLVNPVYTSKLREGTDLYDVVDSKGKVLNDKALPKDVADRLISDLAK
jgi:hypothetical protein